MNLQTWAEWVARINTLTAGGRVVLLTSEQGMVISVEWELDGKHCVSAHELTIMEMRTMGEAEQLSTLDRITSAVRKRVKIHTPKF